MHRMPLVADFVLSMVLCASLALWGVAFFKPPSHPLAPFAQEAAPPMPSIEAAAGLFGGQTEVSRNVQLMGVIAAGVEGVAILSAAGKPPQVVGVGMEAGPGITVNEVNATYVLLNDGGNIKRIDLPQNAKGAQIVSVPASPLPVAQVNAVQATLLVNQVNEVQAPVTHAANKVASEQLSSEPQSPIDYFNSHVPTQDPSRRRPGGMGPAAALAGR